jgi:hypothetical protein
VLLRKNLNPGFWNLEFGTLELWNYGTLEPWNPGTINLRIIFSGSSIIYNFELF